MGDVAIAHDQLLTYGGAERVAVEHARTFDAPIYAGWVDRDAVPDDVDVVEVFSGSRVADLAQAAPHPLPKDIYQLGAWQHVPELYEYDTVLINKTNPGWFVPRDEQTTVWYVHSTPRGINDQFHRRGGGLLKPWVGALQRALYRPNVNRADSIVANSELVARRCHRYWDRAADHVIYPPVNTEALGPDVAPTDDYYLSLGRLHHAKRVRDIVKAANRLELPLKVAGDGAQYDALAELAGPTVELLGYVSDQRKRELLSGARALIFAAENEDFGMVPVEALASGTPVIGVDEGYTHHQIQDGQSGLLFSRGRLGARWREFERDGVAWSAERIADWASQRFGVPVFRRAMQQAVEIAEQQTQVEVPDQPQPEVIADGDD